MEYTLSSALRTAEDLASPPLRPLTYATVIRRLDYDKGDDRDIFAMKLLQSRIPSPPLLHLRKCQLHAMKERQRCRDEANASPLSRLRPPFLSPLISDCSLVCDELMMSQSMWRPLVITQRLHLPWARKQVIDSFLAQGKRRSCVITDSLNIL